MAISEYTKIQRNQRELDRQLEGIARKRTDLWIRDTKVSHCMHVSAETLRRLEVRGKAQVRD